MRVSCFRLFFILIVIFSITQLVSADLVTFGSGANQFSMEFVPIGNPGNVADTTGRPNPAGAVAYNYNMGKFEVSRDMVTKASAAGNLGITLYDMTSFGGNGVNRPATGVSWNEAARFVNWLNTSQGFTPAYKFTTTPDGTNGTANQNIALWVAGDAGFNAANPFRNSQARYFLPSVDEWYKAAYYDANANSGAGGYWDFPTGSSGPSPVAFGTSAGTAVYNQPVSQGPADVTQAGGLSPYGVMALGGNVREWDETESDLVNDSPSAIRILRGGFWTSTNGDMNASIWSPNNPQINGADVGFRVASTSIPEPTLLLFWTSLSAAAAGVAIVRYVRPAAQLRKSKP